MTYIPRPLDTSGITLNEDILKLTERLAAHNHDIWAQRRIREGWTHGPNRDDERKKHPCLVPYEDLPDSEKQYDRETALEVLKVILAAGYQILKVE